MTANKVAPANTPRHSPASIQQAILDTRGKVHAAVHAILDEAGLTGITVHSVNFAVAPNAMTTSACPNCDLTKNDCVLTPNGYVCLPTGN